MFLKYPPGIWAVSSATPTFCNNQVFSVVKSAELDCSIKSGQSVEFQAEKAVRIPTVQIVGDIIGVATLKKYLIPEQPSTIEASLIRSGISSKAFRNIKPEKTEATNGLVRAKID